MRAVERTTRLFVASVKDAMPDVRLQVYRSKNAYGRSNYVYIPRGRHLQPVKVRISDHPVGMRRALSRQEHLYIPAGARPSSWAVWLGELCRQVTALNGAQKKAAPGHEAKGGKSGEETPKEGICPPLDGPRVSLR